MGKFDTGVPYYTIADLSIQIGFPCSEVKCRWCKFLKHYDGINRDKCGVTDDIIYSLEQRGINCPLVILNQVESEDMKK